MSVYVYRGIPKREEKEIRKRIAAGFRVPPQRTDLSLSGLKKGDAMYVFREKMREEYKMQRIQELEEEIKMRDTLTQVCGVVFEKDKPVDISQVLDEDGEPREFLSAELKKFDRLLEKVEAKAEDKTEEKKKRGRPKKSLGGDYNPED